MALHSEVTKQFPTPEQRIIGFVLHSEKIEVFVQPQGFTKFFNLIIECIQSKDYDTISCMNKVFSLDN